MRRGAPIGIELRATGISGALPYDYQYTYYTLQSEIWQTGSGPKSQLPALKREVESINRKLLPNQTLSARDVNLAFQSAQNGTFSSDKLPEAGARIIGRSSEPATVSANAAIPRAELGGSVTASAGRSGAPGTYPNRPDSNSCIVELPQPGGGGPGEVKIKNKCSYKIAAVIKSDRRRIPPSRGAKGDGYNVYLEAEMWPGNEGSQFINGPYDITSCRLDLKGCSWDWLFYLQACKRWPSAPTPDSKFDGFDIISYALIGPNVTDKERFSFQTEFHATRRQYLTESVFPAASEDYAKIFECALKAEQDVEKIRARVHAKWTK